MNAEDAIRICVDLVKNHGWTARVTPNTRSIRLFSPDSTVEYDLLSAAVSSVYGQYVDMWGAMFMATRTLKIMGSMEESWLLCLADESDNPAFMEVLTPRRERLEKELGIKKPKADE